MKILDDSAAEAKKLVGIRSKIAANAQAWRAIGKSRLTDAEIEARVRTELSEFARGAAGPLGAMAYTPDSRYPAPNYLADLLASPRGIAAVLGETLVEPLVAAIIENGGGDAQALSAQERKDQEQTLSSEKHKLAVAEEREILRLEALGYTVVRRPDVDGETLLGIWNDEMENDAAA
jgi:hypothetical protein